MSRQYLVGLFNILIGLVLSILLSLLIYFHVVEYLWLYEDKLSLDFLWFDGFATRLIALVLLAMLSNFICSAVMFSSFFSFKTKTNSMAFSVSSILWVVLYIASDFAVRQPLFLFLPIGIGLVLFVVAGQAYSTKLHLGLYLAGSVVFAVAIGTNLLNANCLWATPETIDKILEEPLSRKALLEQRQWGSVFRLVRSCWRG